MPASTRQQAVSRLRSDTRRSEQAGVSSTNIETSADIDASTHYVDTTNSSAEDVEENDEEDVREVVEEDVPFPPPGLKEISSLASWTVSSSKPGNGIAALRSLDTSQFWQSDGPQPHLLSIHFFKLVSIVHMRIYLNFASDESYTPTKMQFSAGMGEYDLQEFAEMTFERPMGWIDVDFSNIGPVDADESSIVDEHGHREIDWSKRPVLRAFLIQVRILENHQNGKDTHLRAIQLFARDDSAPSTSRALRETRPSTILPVHRKPRANEANNIALASWMQEPNLR